MRTLSLDDAISLAAKKSDEIAVANAGVTRADGNQKIAFSQFLPQLSASASYTRTFLSQYSGLSSSSTTTDTTKGASSGSSSLLKNLPFGKPNQYSLGLQLTQNIFTGGRLTGQKDAADARRRSADLDVTGAETQLTYNVTQSYYDAVLSDQLVTIADSTLRESEQVYQLAEAGFKVGERPEFDALRARVTRDNQLPIVFQRRNDRATAYYKLKQLLNVSLDDSLVLTTPVQDSVARFAALSDTTTEERIAVRQGHENITANEAQVRVAESERWPQIQISSRYAPVAYPTDILPSFSDFHTDWTASLSISIPIYTGGRITGDEEVADAGLEEAKARLQQSQEAASLDSRQALNDLEQARATLRSTASTAELAKRANMIARVRYQQGISTQIELFDARLQEDQALANEARAVRNYQVARAKVSLLRDLPLSIGGGIPTAALGAQSQTQPNAILQQTSTSQSPQTTTTGTGVPGTTGP